MYNISYHAANNDFPYAISIHIGWMMVCNSLYWNCTYLHIWDAVVHTYTLNRWRHPVSRMYLYARYIHLQHRSWYAQLLMRFDIIYFKRDDAYEKIVKHTHRNIYLTALWVDKIVLKSHTRFRTHNQISHMIKENREYWCTQSAHTATMNPWTNITDWCVRITTTTISTPPPCTSPQLDLHGEPGNVCTHLHRLCADAKHKPIV